MFSCLFLLSSHFEGLFVGTIRQSALTSANPRRHPFQLAILYPVCMYPCAIYNKGGNAMLDGKPYGKSPTLTERSHVRRPKTKRVYQVKIFIKRLYRDREVLRACSSMGTTMLRGCRTDTWSTDLPQEKSAMSCSSYGSHLAPHPYPRSFAWPTFEIVRSSFIKKKKTL